MKLPPWATSQNRGLRFSGLRFSGLRFSGSRTLLRRAWGLGALLSALIAFPLTGCASCSGDGLFTSAATGELRAVHELGEFGAPLVPPPQTYGLRRLDEAYDALRPHLAHKNPFHRLVALEALRHLAQRSRGMFATRFPDLFDSLLDDPDPELRWRAAWALGRIALGRPGLQRAAQDEDLRVADRAIWALGQVRSPDPGVVPLLLASLDRDPLSARVMDSLRALTGERHETPQAWRAWAVEVGVPSSKPAGSPAAPSDKSSRDKMPDGPSDEQR